MRRLHQASCLTVGFLAMVAVTGVACRQRPPQPGTPAVQARTITVDDARLGRLTFDALAAGTPAAAQQGRLVLLLHGFPETAEAWRPILDRLAGAGWYAVAPNQRGFSPGARPPAVADYELPNMVEDALGLATALGADRFHLVGHDWGGAVAWRVARSAPERVSSLVALSTPHPDAFADAWENPNGEQQRLSAYMSMFRTEGADATLSASFTTLFGAMGIPSSYVQAYEDVLGNRDAMRAALNWYRANPNPPRRIGTVEVRTRYLWGTSDIALGRTAAEGTARYVSAAYEFQPIQGGSHWLPETRTEVVTAAILAHLQD